MKSLFTILFSAYILVLSAAPCNDIHAGHDEIVITTQQAQNHHKQHEDLCPPFCHCNCCGANAENIFTKIYSETEAKNIPFNKYYTSQYHSSYSHGIWQPPRLS